MLWLEEYKSLRAESEQARNAQQTILQWSLAAFAAIIAGLLLMFQVSGISHIKFSGEAGAIILFISGFGLPGLGFFAYLIWWGEFLRMERAGRYIRGLELVAQFITNSDNTRVPPPLQWEHFLAGSNRAKELVGYVGATGIYFGFSFSSLLFYISVVASHAYDLRSWTGPVEFLSWAWVPMYVAIFVSVTWRYRRLADRRSKQGIRPEDALPPIEFVLSRYRLSVNTSAVQGPEPELESAASTAQEGTSQAPDLPAHEVPEIA